MIRGGVSTRGEERAAQLPGERLRQGFAIVLFGLVTLLLLAAEQVLGHSLPTWLWTALMALGLLAWTVQLTRQKAPEKESGAEAETAPSPDAAGARSQQDISQAFTIVSHEIGTPINAIVGFSELLRDAEHHNLPAAKRRDYAELILSNARHLQRRVSDMVDAGRLVSGQIILNEQDCDLGEITEIAARNAETEAARGGVTLLAQVANGIVLHGDTQKLLRAISCLIDNAIKFSPHDSYINIKMLGRPGEDVSIAITDTGAGLAPADIERVFAPYRQGSEGNARSHGGLGLGLYIAREIAKLHGGELTLSSQMGVGTEARLRLPAHRLTWPEAASIPEAPIAKVA